MYSLTNTVDALRELNVSEKAIEIYNLLYFYHSSFGEKSNISLMKICMVCNTEYEKTKDYLVELLQNRFLVITRIYDEFTTEERYDYKVRVLDNLLIKKRDNSSLIKTPMMEHFNKYEVSTKAIDLYVEKFLFNNNGDISLGELKEELETTSTTEVLFILNQLIGVGILGIESIENIYTEKETYTYKSYVIKKKRK